MPYFRNQNDYEIYFEIFNEDSNLPVLILIHEYGSSQTIFSKQKRFLAQYFKLILFDVIGHGNSDKNPYELQENMINSTLNDLSNLLTYLSIEGSISILGYGLFGTATAQQFTIINRNCVNFLILLNGGNLFIDSTIKNIFWNLLPKYSRVNFNEIINQSFDEIVDQISPLIEKIIQPDEVILSKRDRDLIKNRIKDEIWDLNEFQIESSKISCPTLIICAELDEEAPIYFSKQLRKNIRDSEYHMVSMTGHLGISQRHEEYNNIIYTFLQNNNFISTG
ncbi:alpha/beta fold hydrolase [Candidatus Lokiarchaeum ossiferum]|uniref:alpha/beta fold hydrolase n=1 Tax=Candidatus Lokiarchaeum ossiferum TaxID=2951803 RepID=UPI00352D89D2